MGRTTQCFLLETNGGGCVWLNIGLLHFSLYNSSSVAVLSLQKCSLTILLLNALPLICMSCTSLNTTLSQSYLCILKPSSQNANVIQLICIDYEY